MEYFKVTDPDFQRLSSDPADFKDNYEYDMNVIGRRTIFAHTIKNLVETRAALLTIESHNELFPGKPLQLKYDQIPNIRYED